MPDRAQLDGIMADMRAGWRYCDLSGNTQDNNLVRFALLDDGGAIIDALNANGKPWSCRITPERLDVLRLVLTPPHGVQLVKVEATETPTVWTEGALKVLKNVHARLDEVKEAYGSDSQEYATM